jgi:TrmH family RNA methyltransferase
VCSELIDLDPNEFPGIIRTEVSREVFKAMAFGHRLKGILAVCRPEPRTLVDLTWEGPGALLVLDRVEKPGNIGSVLRSADGAGLHGVLLSDPRTDLYNQHVVRSSIGTLFTVPTVAASSEAILGFLRSNAIRIFIATAKAKRCYYDADLTQPVAIIIGNEHEGVSEFWKANSDEAVTIPMMGDMECLNAAHSASILMYELLRQRSGRSV